MPPDSEAANQRVTNAILKKDIEHLTGTVVSYCEKSDARAKDHEDRIRTVEKEQTKLKTIVGVWNGINSLGIIVATTFKGFLNGE